MQEHLKPRDIERIAKAGDTGHAHLATCGRCRLEVERWRQLDRALDQLGHLDGPAGFTERVMSRVTLPAPWLDRVLAYLPSVEVPRGFAAAVMQRVQLPVPWTRRALAFARERRFAVAAVFATLFTVSGAGAYWLFGAQGIAPTQLAAFGWDGMRELAVGGLLYLGRLGYRLGLVEGGTGLMEGISAGQALSLMALIGTLGLMALWTMIRLSRPGFVWARVDYR